MVFGMNCIESKGLSQGIKNIPARKQGGASPGQGTAGIKNFN
jgi:hypothetical protein